MSCGPYVLFTPTVLAHSCSTWDGRNNLAPRTHFIHTKSTNYWPVMSSFVYYRTSSILDRLTVNTSRAQPRHRFPDVPCVTQMSMPRIISLGGNWQNAYYEVWARFTRPIDSRS